MPFIGQQPTTGAFLELDSLTASATADYTLQLNGANYYPESVNNLLVSINGIIQGSSTMSLSGSTLTVGATLSSSDVIDFVRVFGNVGTISTPTDGSVTVNKLGTGAVTNAKIADSTLDLTSKVTGVLPVANGGTGVSSGFSYAEGTFTPTWDGYPSAKVSSTSGKYIKIGNQVTVYMKLVTGTDTDASSVGVNNLPYTISGDLGAGTVYHNSAGLRDMHIVTRFTSNSTSCFLDGVLSGADTTIKYVGTSPAIGGSSTLIWVVFYQTI